MHSGKDSTFECVSKTKAELNHDFKRSQVKKNTDMQKIPRDGKKLASSCFGVSIAPTWLRTCILGLTSP